MIYLYIKHINGQMIACSPLVRLRESAPRIIILSTDVVKSNDTIITVATAARAHQRIFSDEKQKNQHE